VIVVVVENLYKYNYVAYYNVMVIIKERNFTCDSFLINFSFTFQNFKHYFRASIIINAVMATTNRPYCYYHTYFIMVNH